MEVLLVDDDEDEHIIFSDALGCLPGQVRCNYAHCVEKAFEMLEHMEPDFIFVDMNMPRINGIEFIRRLKSTNKGHPRSIILYSTNMDDALSQSAKMAGALGCMKKTDSLSALVEKLTSYFGAA